MSDDGKVCALAAAEEIARLLSRAEAAEAENAAYVEAYDLLAKQGKADNAEAAALRKQLTRICTSVVSVLKEDGGDVDDLQHNLPDEWARAMDAHECGGPDDITCQGQNCGMFIGNAALETP